MLDSKMFPPIRSFHLLTLCILMASLSPRIAAQSQPATPNIDPAISKLAAQIAEPLQKANATKIVVADLQGPDGQMHPVGRWLAEQLSSYIRNDFPSLNLIARSPQDKIAGDKGDSGDPLLDLAKRKDWAKKLGADVIITGSYARVSKGIGVSLTALNLARPGPWLSQTNGLVPTSDEITALSPDPIPSFKGGIAKAGIGGVSLPTCLYCPIPQYSSEARAAKVQGSVVLQATITVDGRAINISVVKGPGKGLEEKAIEAVKNWKFKPANNAEGELVPTIVPIEVTFRLYNK
jgi:TonB family protein